MGLLVAGALLLGVTVEEGWLLGDVLGLTAAVLGLVLGGSVAEPLLGDVLGVTDAVLGLVLGVSVAGPLLGDLALPPHAAVPMTMTKLSTTSKASAPARPRTGRCRAPVVG